MKPVILTDIFYVKEDFLTKGHPYIPAVARQYHALAILTSGRMRYTVNGRSAELSAGDILFIHAGNIDCAETATDTPVHYITVDFQSMDHQADMAQIYRSVSAELLPLFLRILAVFHAHRENWLMKSLSLLYHILNILRESDTTSKEIPEDHLRISKAVELIGYRLSDPALTVTDMANACGISTVTLNRAFRAVYHTTASTYLLRRRMDLAKALLLNSVNTIGEVAASVGYSDIYAFTHAFTRTFSVCPRAWRVHPDLPQKDKK